MMGNTMCHLGKSRKLNKKYTYNAKHLLICVFHALNKLCFYMFFFYEEKVIYLPNKLIRVLLNLYDLIIYFKTKKGMK